MRPYKRCVEKRRPFEEKDSIDRNKPHLNKILHETLIQEVEESLLGMRHLRRVDALDVYRYAQRHAEMLHKETLPMRRLVAHALVRSFCNSWSAITT